MPPPRVLKTFILNAFRVSTGILRPAVYENVIYFASSKINLALFLHNKK